MATCRSSICWRACRTCLTFRQLAWTGARRTINDLTATGEGQEFATRLVEYGYRSSYTVPIQHKGTFYGFLFFNSSEVNFFSPSNLNRLRPYAELISLSVMRELDTVRMMHAAVKVIRSVSSALTKKPGPIWPAWPVMPGMIAEKLAPKYGLTDEFVEFVFQFAPLHDVGKVGMPILSC